MLAKYFALFLLTLSFLVGGAEFAFLGHNYFDSGKAQFQEFAALYLKSVFEHLQPLIEGSKESS